jgi:hypothetical protein
VVIFPYLSLRPVGMGSCFAGTTIGWTQGRR